MFNFHNFVIFQVSPLLLISTFTSLRLKKMHFWVSVMAKLLTWALLCLPPIAAILFPSGQCDFPRTYRTETLFPLFSSVPTLKPYMHDKAMKWPGDIRKFLQVPMDRGRWWGSERAREGFTFYSGWFLSQRQPETVKHKWETSSHQRGGDSEVQRYSIIRLKFPVSRKLSHRT